MKGFTKKILLLKYYQFVLILSKTNLTTDPRKNAKTPSETSEVMHVTSKNKKNFAEHVERNVTNAW
jgi:hypothetical protein